MKNYETTPSPFYKSLMAGLFTGIIITIFNLVFASIYRSITSFNLSMVVNITTIIFFSLIASVVAGLLYYFIVPFSQKSKSIYSLIWLVLTASLIFGAFTIHREGDIKISQQFHFIVAGILVITCLFDIFLIPYMSTHKNPVF